MTDDEQKLFNIADRLVKIMSEEYPEVNFFFQFIDSTKKETAAFIGNGCPVCAVGRAVEWIDDNQIQHTGEDDLEKVH